jgi:hypothetical protein
MFAAEWSLLMLDIVGGVLGAVLIILIRRRRSQYPH